MMNDAVLGILVMLLALASWHDVKYQRIPNRLVLVGILVGVAANGLLPPGFGFDSAVLPGGVGWPSALQGMALGLVVLLPFYWLRAMGAGDVKLMAMVGSFLGLVHVQGALLGTFLAGGVMGLLVALRKRMFWRLMQNLKLMLLGSMVKASVGQTPVMDDVPASVGKMPYGVAIAAGTLGYLVWQRLR